MHARCWRASRWPCDALEDRAGDQVDAAARARVARAQAIAGPSSGSAAARSSSSEPIAVHFSGSTTSCAPSAAAARVRRSAAARFAAVGGRVELDCGDPQERIPPASAPARPRALRTNRLTGQSTTQSITADAASARSGLAERPSRMSLLRGARPLKRWRYVGVFCEQLMACAAHRADRPGASVLLGAVPAASGRAARAHAPAAARAARSSCAARRRGAGGSQPGLLRIRDRGVELDLTLEEEAGVEARCPHGRARCGRASRPASPRSGTLALDGGAPTSGRRARGDRRHRRPPRAPHRVALERRRRAERRRQRAGVEPRQRRQRPAERLRARGVGRRRAARGGAGELRDGPLDAIRATTAASCASTPRRERSRSDEPAARAAATTARRSARFSGTLPGGVALAHGLGVMEHHRARW